ncbi:DNA polymerase interacting tetratricopeptide repeat-containing, protein of 47 kDa [Schistocerca americana]|uniref:DNA polymerase interacting tetratricopeptide repeat-containing, protein of 47 kDa n=1 Tax=Schistocerca americana TaxID=7009 RepID=UPI001F4FB8C2|nr:DNA polymerase interacting tetratricopeptide repeat-containing, protein of 47 kDa [Schistocerca americana]XP_049941460.1 DNA polymerase interacting tetratricopeptide repeat-containing, protein of 47 kDa [Schistocerca serialis cubense]
MENHSAKPKKTSQMTDEERLQLAEKLDKELDEYIAGLERRPYTEGWPEDRWREEMEKHPFFMTKPPEEGQPLSPLLEGIQQLKYDESENTPEELAATYKEDGNFNFKCKKYRVAIISYTEGLRQKCSDDSLNAQLFNNRAAAHFFLKNYRSCLADCRAALKVQPGYPKALSRAAECSFRLSLFDDCIAFCDEMLATSTSNKEALELRAKAVATKKRAEMQARRQAVARRKQEAEEKELAAAIKERNLNIEGQSGPEIKLKLLQPISPHGVQKRVHLSEGRLVWPVILLYPEYETSDYIQEFPEDCRFEDQLTTIFETPPEWDKEGKYRPENLRLWYEDREEKVKFPVNKENTLGETLSDKRIIIRNGTPVFCVEVVGKDRK